MKLNVPLNKGIKQISVQPFPGLECNSFHGVSRRRIGAQRPSLNLYTSRTVLASAVLPAFCHLVSLCDICDGKR
jgi:hypothetical protein